jgi:hypothetical protein
MPSNNNDLVDRYLQAIGFWLPKSTRQDILAEISEDLRSQIEDRSAALKRPLTEADIADILKHRGHPAVVAGAYLPQQSLIGPVFFQAYKLTFQIVLVCYIIPWLIFWLVFLFSSPHQIHIPSATALIRSVGFWWLSVVNTLAIITLAFYALDRGWLRSRFTGDWDPGKLPKIQTAKPRRRSSDIGTVVFGTLYLGWLLVVPDFPFLIIGPAAFFVTPAHIWHTVYPLILILAVAGVLEPGLNLLIHMPAWERPVFKLANNGFALWVVNILLHAPTYFVAQGQQAQQYAAATNMIVIIALVGTGVGLTIALVVEAIKLIYSLIRRATPAVPRTV